MLFVVEGKRVGVPFFGGREQEGRKEVRKRAYEGKPMVVQPVASLRDTEGQMDREKLIAAYIRALEARLR